MAANDGRHATPTVTVTDSRRGARPTKPALDPKRLAALSRRILGLPHNLSVHPGGIVIAPGGVDAHVPLQPAAKGVLITQMDKDGVEDVRLVKIDLLGNRNLSTVRYATDLIRRRHGVEIDIEALPKDDPETIDLLRDGRTIGCNQLESPAMRNLLRMMQPSNTRDVMKALALIRPGAASIGMKEVFVRRQRGIDPVPPDRPEVAAVLGATHGVMLYEDDVMLTAAAMLRCELPQADRFRKAVQKCQDDAQRLAISREFLGRCQANGVDLEYAKGIWVQMAKFNAYSFCRAHAASYAVLAYAGAYLKTHYPLEFWLASLNNNQSMYPPRAYVEQAKRQGVQFLLPDVNRSEAEFSLEERRLSPFSSLSLENADSPRSPEEGASPHLHAALRVGLGRVEGLGPANVEAILNARRRGPFTGLSDCLGRIGLGRNEARSLVLCGAFDWTGRTRPTLMMELNLFYALGSWRHSPDVVLLPTGPTIPNVPGDYSPRQKYLQERHILGLSVGEHILAFYRGLTRGVGILPARHAGVSPAACSSSNSAERQASPQQQWEVDSRALSSCVGRTVRIAGMLEAYRATPTQKGETMLFLTLDDEYGVFEATLFPPQARALGMSLDRYGPYVIIGKVEQQYGVVSVTADQVELVNCEGLLENEGDGE